MCQSVHDDVTHLRGVSLFAMTVTFSPNYICSLIQSLFLCMTLRQSTRASHITHKVLSYSSTRCHIVAVARRQCIVASATQRPAILEKIACEEQVVTRLGTMTPSDRLKWLLINFIQLFLIFFRVCVYRTEAAVLGERPSLSVKKARCHQSCFA